MDKYRTEKLLPLNPSVKLSCLTEGLSYLKISVKYDGGYSSTANKFLRYIDVGSCKE